MDFGLQRVPRGNKQKKREKIMKQYISKIIVGCLGLSVGFAICYFTLVSSKTEAKATVITVASDGSLYLGSQQLDLSQLSTNLKKQTAHGYMITIRANGKTDCKRVVAVLEVCKAAGVTQIAMRTLAAK
jgi:hypothetical protein